MCPNMRGVYLETACPLCFIKPLIGWQTFQISKGKFCQNIFDLRTIFFFFFEYSLGLVFCTTQFEYFEKFLYFWPNRQTGWKQSSNGGNQQRHIWEWALLEPKSEVLERRPRLFHVYQASCLTDGMEVVRLHNKPVAWGQGRGSHLNGAYNSDCLE